MTNREKIIRGFGNWCDAMADECPVICHRVLDLLEAKPPIHVHKEFPEHDWKTYENGEVDHFAWGQEYCNGPFCKRCYYAFCIHCEPNGWNKKPCIIDFFKCPNCGEEINKNTKFCDNCGQAVKWDA